MDLVPGLLAMQMSRVFTVSENKKNVDSSPGKPLGAGGHNSK